MYLGHPFVMPIAYPIEKAFVMSYHAPNHHAYLPAFLLSPVRPKESIEEVAEHLPCSTLPREDLLKPICKWVIASLSLPASLIIKPSRQIDGGVRVGTRYPITFRVAGRGTRFATG